MPAAPEAWTDTDEGPIDPKDERFPKSERLLKRSDFRRTEREGRRVTSKHFIVYGRRNEFDFSRVGLTLSRKVGKAHVRNRFKRRIREIFRRNKGDFPDDFDYVVIVRRQKDDGEPAFDALKKELIRLLNEAARPKTK